MWLTFISFGSSGRNDGSFDFNVLKGRYFSVSGTRRSNDDRVDSYDKGTRGNGLVFVKSI